jgi:anti-anti-sigma regulatory factor
LEYFEKHFSGDTLIETVNLLRASHMEASIMKNRLLEDIQLNNKKIIIDISKCDYIDSSFIGAMVVSLKKIRGEGGDIKIVSSSYTAGIAFLVGCNKLFEGYTSVEDAIKSFGLYSKESKLEFINHTT